MKVAAAKVLLFCVLIGTFWALGGFERPQVKQESLRSAPKITRAWVMTVALFVVGAVTMFWGRQIGDALSQDYPHGTYFIIGFLLAVAGFIWMLMVRDAARL